MELALIQPYVNMTRVLVRRKGASYPAPGLTGAIVDGREIPEEIVVEKIQTYETITDALKAVNKGDVDLLYALSNHAEPDIQKYHFSNLMITTMSDSRNPVSFALPKPADPQLLSILNKAVGELSEEQKSVIMEKNVFSVGDARMPLTELVYSNPSLFIILILVLLLLVVTVIFVWSRARVRAAAMSSELEKAEAAGRAKSEFLSRISHELRTPMNAVVGLADLAVMQSELPEPAKETLSKLRSASRYLLSLINDIPGHQPYRPGRHDPVKRVLFPQPNAGPAPGDDERRGRPPESGLCHPTGRYPRLAAGGFHPAVPGAHQPAVQRV